MKTFQVLKLLTLAGIAPFIAAPSFAQDSYFYGGAGAGKSRTNLDDAGVTSTVIAPGPVVSGVSRDAKDNAYKVFLGYQFNPYVGMEIGYFHFGQFSWNATTVPAGNLHGQVRLQGGNLDLVGTLPITDKFSGLARVGVQMARTRDVFTGSGAAVVTNPTPSQREADVKVGVGLQYAFSPNFMMRTELERFRINDAVGHHPNVNLYSVSFVVPFGRSPAPAMHAAAAVYEPPAMPAPVAPVAEVAPTPVAVIVPAPPPPAPAPVRRVTYSAQSLFSFDRAVLRPQGKVALDGFAQELRDTRYSHVTVEGYTDRLGTEAYNDKLSQERADVVKAYLVESGHIDGSQITAVGKGESSPVTQAQDCTGKVATARLIACLQPDRRVEIAVAGTQK
ncbi:MAG: OmpA family protein [Burkholderiales bacterium]|nr:OmpA family protein [Burkholderiales bacterium]